MKRFSHSPITILWTKNTPMETNDWKLDTWKVLVVSDAHKALFGLDLFPAIGR